MRNESTDRDTGNGRTGGEDGRLARYLLDLLPDEDRDDLERDLLADGVLADEVAATEDELFDSYAAGELTGTEAAAFESRLKASAGLRRRLAFARALHRAVAEEAAHAGQSGAGTVAAEPMGRLLTWPGWLRPLGRPAAGLVAAAAAALLAVVSGTLLWQTGELRDRVMRLEQERQALAAEQGELTVRGDKLAESLAAERSQTADLGTELDRQRQRADRVTEELEDTRRRPTRKPLTASFVLSAALRSDLGSRAFELPPDVEEVALRLDLGVAEPYTAYLAVIDGPAGNEVWSRGAIAPDRRQPATSVVLTLPAEILAEGRHEVLLYGEPKTAGPGTPELVGAFDLEVVRR